MVAACCAVTCYARAVLAHTLREAECRTTTQVVLGEDFCKTGKCFTQEAASLDSSEEELRPPNPMAVPPEWENAQQLQRDGTTYRTVIRSVNRARSLAWLQRRDCLQLDRPAAAAVQTGLAAWGHVQSTKGSKAYTIIIIVEMQACGEVIIIIVEMQACGDVGKAWSFVFKPPHACTAECTAVFLLLEGFL